VLVTATGARASPGLSAFAKRSGESRASMVEIVYPVHPNPQLPRPWPDSRRAAAYPSDRAARLRLLRGFDAARLSSLDRLRRVQEEAPSLGKPALIMRKRRSAPRPWRPDAELVEPTWRKSYLQRMADPDRWSMSGGQNTKPLRRWQGSRQDHEAIRAFSRVSRLIRASRDPLDIPKP